MELVLAILLGGLLAFGLIKLRKHKSLYPLLPKKYNFGKRRDTLKKVLEMMELRQARVLLETGIARDGLRRTKGDGASTILFGQWAKLHNAKLYSVDIDAQAVAVANREIKQMGLDEHVFTQVSDSIEYLSRFTQPVDLLYLDSYDYDKRDQVIQKASQEHHLKEFKAIENQLGDQTVVLIDDCNLPGGGKGKSVIVHMLANGWEVVMQDYQVILQKAQSRTS